MESHTTHAQATKPPCRPGGLSLQPVPMIRTRENTSPSPSMARPPTPGGGPLNSHPTTPIGHYTPPVFPEPDEEHTPAPVDSPLDLSSTKSIETTVTLFPPSLEEAAAAYAAAGAAPSLRTSRPASAHLTTLSSRSPEPEPKPSTLPRSTSGGLKRLLSLSSLRHGFQTSRTSSDLSTLTTNNASTTWFASPPGSKRRGSVAKSPDSATVQNPRKRSSGAWFRRASVMWSDDRADSVIDEAYVLNAGGEKGRKESVPRGGTAPMLPEIPELGIKGTTEDWGAGLRADIGKA